MYIFILILLLTQICMVYSHRKIKLKFLKKSADLDSLFLILDIVLLWFVLSFKAQHVGTDTVTYEIVYHNAYTYLESGIRGLNWKYQPLYYVLFGTLETAGIAFKTALVIIYIFAFVSLYHFINKFSRNKVLSVFFFFTLSMIDFYMSGLRQMIALSFGLWAMDFLYCKKKKSAIAAFVIAFLFHPSSAALFPIFVLEIFGRKRRNLEFIMISMWAVAALFPQSIFDFILSRAGYYSYYGIENGVSTNILLLAVYLAIACFVLFTMRAKHWDEKKMIYLTPISGLCICLWIFSTKNFYISRMAYYYQIPLFVVFAEALEKYTKRKEILFFIFITGLFILQYFIVSSIDSLNIRPYEFFWQAGEMWK